MKRALTFISALQLALAIATFAQTATNTAPGSAVAPTIVLPQKLVAGEPATLAVIGADGRLVVDVQVEFSGGVRFTTDSTGRARFRAPSAEGVLLAKIPGSTAVSSATVLAPPSAAKFAISDAPHIISLRDRFSVSGAGFSGDADANTVQLGGNAAAVIAASPVNLVIVAGKDAVPGPSQLVIGVQDGGGPSATVPVTLVSVNFIPAKSQLAPREKGKLTVRVQGTDEPLNLEARNLSSDVIRFRRGDVQRVRTRGGADNSATIEIEGRQPGEYSLSVRVLPPPLGAPDTEAARQYLLAAGRLAPPKEGHRIEKLIHQLDRKPQDSIKVRNALEKLLAAKPEGEYGRLLEAAWEVLLNR